MRILIIALLIAALVVPASYAADKPVYVEATGEAAGSDLESPREIFERAKADAQRNAIEIAVGTFIHSHTLVTNGQLADDLIFARVRGKIDRLEVIKQERSATGNSCRVQVKALVSPVYPEKRDSIQIKAALTRSSFKVDEEVGIQYQVNTESHVYLFVVGADNSVTQLLPNSEMRDNIAKANRAYTFPPSDCSIRLKAALLPESRKTGAEEKVKIIATRRSEPLLEKGFHEGFAVYDARSTGLISDLLKRLNQLDPTDWGEMTLVYQIAPEAAR